MVSPTHKVCPSRSPAPAHRIATPSYRYVTLFRHICNISLTSSQKLNANVAAGHVLTNPGVQVSFPTDNSKGSQLARLQTAIVTLQNLNGPGQGCPVVSTTFLLQQDAINAGQDPNSVVAPQPAGSAPPPSRPAAPAPPPPPPAAAGPPNQGQIAALAPPLGFRSGVNPTG